MNRLRIGLFPGAFNPFQNDHLKIAVNWRDNLNLDFVFVQPTPYPPGKDNFANIYQRRDMVALAIKDEPALILSDLEPANVHSTNYTIDLVKKIRGMFPMEMIYLLMGQDEAQLYESGTWKDHQLFKRYVTIEVAPRAKDALSSTWVRSCIKYTHNSGCLADGKDPSKMLHPSVWTYITNHGLYKDD